MGYLKLSYASTIITSQTIVTFFGCSHVRVISFESKRQFLILGLIFFSFYLVVHHRCCSMIVTFNTVVPGAVVHMALAFITIFAVDVGVCC